MKRCNFVLYLSLNFILGVVLNYIPATGTQTECGKRISKRNLFENNQHKAHLGDYPWHVGIYTKMDTEIQYICGGAIISNKIILSSAICFYKMDPSSYFVAAEKIYSDWSDERDKNPQKRNISKIIIHDDYGGSHTAFLASIAMVVLTEPLVFSDHVQPVCIDYNMNTCEANEYLNTRTGEISGWGSSLEQINSSVPLTYDKVPLMKLSECLRKAPMEYKKFVQFDKICIGHTSEKRECLGYSGGGLVTSKNDLNGNDIYYLNGLVSTAAFARDYCRSLEYTTLVNIAEYRRWILLHKNANE